MKSFASRPPWKALSRRISYEDKQKIWGLVGYQPHPKQEIIHRSEARFKVLSCGRRFGKTEGVAVHEILPILMLGGWVWNIGPDYRTAGKLWREVHKRFLMYPDIGRYVLDVHEAEGKELITLTTGGLIAAKSSAGLNRGDGLDYVAFDEAGHEPSPVPWRYALRPSLMDYEGGGLFTSTPDGMNWFKDFWDKGQEGSEVEGEEGAGQLLGRWESWKFSSYDNPHLSQAEIDEMCEDATEDEIQQEIYGEFLQGVGAVFRGYLEVSTAAFDTRPHPDHQYVLAIDPATVRDFCGMCVWDLTDNRWAYAERFNKVDWGTIKDRSVSLSSDWNDCPVIIDATNQSAFAEELTHEIDWAMVIPFVFTATSKAQLIRDLALGIQKKEVRLPMREQPKHVGAELQKVAKAINSEFGWFRYEKNERTGNIKMQAPEGKTDDMVMCGALGYHYALHYGQMQPPRARQEEEDIRPSLKEEYGRPIAARTPIFSKGRRSFRDRR